MGVQAWRVHNNEIHIWLDVHVPPDAPAPCNLYYPQEQRHISENFKLCQQRLRQKIFPGKEDVAGNHTISHGKEELFSSRLNLSQVPST